MKKKKNTNITLIKTFMKGCTHFFVICIVSSLLSSLCELIIPKIISFSVDSVIGSEAATLHPLLLPLVERIGGVDYLRSHLWLLAGLILIFAALMGIFKYCETVFNRKGSETLVETMRNRLFGHIERLPFSWYMKNQTGDIIQRCTSDVEMVKAFLSEQLTSIISTVILIVMSLVFMFSINIPLALIALVSIPIIIGYSLAFHRYIGDGFEKCDQHEGKLSAICQENLTGVRVVRAFGREKYEVDKYQKQNDIYTNSWVKLGKVLAYFWCTGDIITGIQIMIILVVGTVLCVKGNISVGDLIAIMSYNAMLTWPVRSLGRVISEMSKAGISIGRINEIMETEEECDRVGAVDCDPTGDIVFDHVTFSYDNSTKILDDVSLTIKKGSTVGILGMTGSGKSTLVSLLCRLYETEDGNGTVSISGTDVRNIKSESLRKNVGIILQEPFLFSRTLGENIGITFEDSAAKIEEIREAARAACLDETIEGFSGGYDTVVGERGVTLSGGQKQRTAIARLLAQNPPIMIFDDSLSAVDSETDAKIRRALREKTADATVIIISHRIQTLMSADNIVVMANGRIVEEGNHEELLSLGGTYKKINDIQSSGADEDEEVGK